MNAAAIASALAARAEDVCRHYLPGGSRQGRFWIVGDKDGTPGRSLYVRLHPPGTPGKWNDAATAEHGDLLDIVRQRSGACTLRDTLAEARRFLALPASTALSSTPAADDTYDSVTAARRLWQRGKPLRNTHADAYLRTRGIHCPAYSSLRFNASVTYREGSDTRLLPAMLAAVTRNDGSFIGIQRTWLDPRSPTKASVDSPRKALGHFLGHAVRFTPHTPGAALIVGEGIETVLSIAVLLPTLPAAAALTAGSLAAFTPPESVSHLIIAADNGTAGHTAADRLARRAHSLGLATTVILPHHNDFNEDLAKLGHDVLAARLLPLLKTDP